MFFSPALADGLLLESKWQQVSSGFLILLDILANLNNAVDWMISICPPISNTSRSPPSKFWDYSERVNYSWFHCHPNIPSLFFVPR